jgi:hypothetical protein
MTALGILAAEEAGKLDLVHQLRGAFVVVFAVGLFCGSIYLVLATDVGARLGFLLSAASLTGFLFLLGLIWTTNFTPLNALHGPPPTWKVKEVVDNPAQSKIPQVRQIEKEGKPLDSAAQGEIKASVDAAVTTENGPYQQFSKATDYVVDAAEETGGGKKGLIGHTPQYAVMKIQGVKAVEALPGEAPPTPKADPAKPAKYVVLERDLGALRQPPLFMAIGFGILFAICLAMLHSAEREGQSKGKGELEPSPVLA